EGERAAREPVPASATQRAVGLDAEVGQVEAPADAVVAAAGLVRAVVGAEELDRDVRRGEGDVAERGRVAAGLVLALDADARLVDEHTTSGRDGAHDDGVRPVAPEGRM